MLLPDKKLIIFDLDGTLTKSKSPITEHMASLVTRLLEKAKVAVISGGGYPQIESQFANLLPANNDNYTNLFLLPTSGTRLYRWQGSWIKEYAEDLTASEKVKILTALRTVLHPPVYEAPPKIYGEVIEDRDSQITFSALGQKAPVELKYAWDPRREKREAIAAAIMKKIPEFDVRVGGATSVDITRKGVNKSYGIRKLEDYLKLEPKNIIFVGDALFYGGNDYPARATGVDCISVEGPEDTEKLINSWLDDKGHGLAS